jgi:hypothetical protein
MYRKETRVSIYSSTVEPVSNLSSTHPFSQGDQQPKRDHYSDEDKEGQCDSAHEILLSFIRP